MVESVESENSLVRVGLEHGPKNIEAGNGNVILDILDEDLSFGGVLFIIQSELNGKEFKHNYSETVNIWGDADIALEDFWSEVAAELRSFGNVENDEFLHLILGEGVQFGWLALEGETRFHGVVANIEVLDWLDVVGDLDSGGVVDDLEAVVDGGVFVQDIEGI